MKLKLIVFLIFLLISSAYAENYTIKWGLAIPLSGEGAKAGVDIKRGFELALNDSKKNHITHEFIFEDSQYKNREAVTIAQKLLNLDKVDIVVALWNTADGVAPIAERYNKLHTSIRWNNNIAEKYKNTFTFESTYEDYSKNLAHLFKKLKFKTVSILSADVASWNLALNSFKKIARKENLQIINSQIYLPSENDFRALALKAVRKNPDIVLINDDGERIEELAKKIKIFNINQRITGYITSNIDLKLFEGEYFVSQMPIEKTFAKKFKSKYKEEVFLRAHLAYDMFNIVNQALKKFEKKPSTQELVKSLRKTGNYSGASGPIYNTDNGKVFRTQCEIMKIENSKIILADNIKAIKIN